MVPSTEREAIPTVEFFRGTPRSEALKKCMKFIVPVLPIIVLAALAFTGCGPSSTTDSGNPSATNSSLVETNGLSGVSTNLPATNSLPYVNTNLPTTTNQ